MALDALESHEIPVARQLLDADPSARRELETLTRQLDSLRGQETEPFRAGLASATIARLAEDLVLAGEFDSALGTIRVSVPPVDPPRGQSTILPPVSVDGPVFLSRSRANVLVLAAMALLTVGLLIPAIHKLRYQSELASCQDRLRMLHGALIGYAEIHDGKLPQVGTSHVPSAGAFIQELSRAGQLPVSFVPYCPADRHPGSTSYAYSLGYRSPRGEVMGPRLPPLLASAQEAIVADIPTSSLDRQTPALHTTGWNVLFLDGHVIHTKSPNIGPEGDHIFQTQAGTIGAGISARDVCLGRPYDKP
jgi:prepilin-type processing-associated H-X9-DG protein